MLESNIVLERSFEGGLFWVYKHSSKKFEILAQLNGSTHSVSVGTKTNLEDAEKFLDKVTTVSYRKNLLRLLGLIR
jgi:hypothetical protein